MLKYLDKKLRKRFWFLAIWGLAFVADIISIHFIQYWPIFPLFMLPIPAAEVIVFVGLGYAIFEYDPLEAYPVPRSFDIFYIPFLVIYGLFIAYFVFKAVGR